MYGWMGKILRVDLTTGACIECALDPSVAKDYIGGRGLGIHLLNQEMDPNGDAFSPENPMIMATGPLTGTGAPTGARYMVMTKSPLTGAVTCSNSGGMFPTEFKRTGFDAIMFKGASKSPVYLWIDQGKAELRPADHLWGKDTHQTTDLLLTETHSKAKVACIGPAGEKQVLFASIMNDKHRAAGRSGVGAVMGSKNLKAVVVRGKGRIPLADSDRFKAFNKKILDTFKDDTRDTPLGLTVNGTAGVVTATQNFGVLPTKNWQQGTFDGWEKIDGGQLTKRFLKKNSACYGCPIGCGRLTKVDDPRFAGEGEGPEYETVYAMGSNCMIDDLAAITKANYICNELGMDTITMGATIACAMELVERGYLPEDQVGRSLNWGDAEALVELTRMTGNREGFGDQLAEGSYRLADRYGHPELAPVSKKQEFPGYEPRGSQAMGLAYATSPIGGSHMRGDPAYFELFSVPKPMDPHQWEGKAKVTKAFQDLSAIIDSAGLCIFFAVRNLAAKDLGVAPTGILEYLNAATGADYTLEELMQAGERIINAERLFLTKAGFTRKDDSLPDRLTQTPAPTGPAKGCVCHLDNMLDDYYQVRGWTQNGVPRNALLDQLGLL
ncbi:aldehyde ferredoxin oxidoreductase family protein [Desulfobacula sp.]|uniref:aldehyde ferredoxin oxidoreductase family protein n=1 Tax=Desulfobacula sp. TaxID=2593537 RepID=UPI002617A5DD|nr:aldehyde ferredoxin oxidoreductase family protein [Desulfobacula sp.]